MHHKVIQVRHFSHKMGVFHCLFLSIRTYLDTAVTQRFKITINISASYLLFLDFQCWISAELIAFFMTLSWFNFLAVHSNDLYFYFYWTRDNVFKSNK